MFGGYTENSWIISSNRIVDKNAFVFSVNRKTKYIRKYQQGGIEASSNSFAFSDYINEYDAFRIYDDCLNHGKSYTLYDSVIYNGALLQEMYTTQHYFKVENFEVFKIEY